MDNYATDIEELVKSHKLDEAEEKAREWLLQNPDDLAAKVTLARVLFFEGKEVESETLISEILEVNDQNLDALSLLAFIREWQKRFEEGREILLKILPLSKKQAWVNLRLGKILANSENKGGNQEEAIKYYKAAVIGENPPPEAFQALAYAESDARSVYILQHGISRYPDNVDLWFDLCRQLYHNEDYSRCIESIEKAEANGIKVEESMVIKAFAHYHLKQYDNALKAIMIVEEQDNTRRLVEETIEGLLNYLLGDYQNAEKILLKAIEEDIGNSLQYNGHILLTAVYIRASKIKEAEKVFEEIPLDNKRGFRSNLFLHNGIFLDISIDEHYVEMLEKVIATATAPQVLIRAKFFYALHKYGYRWGENLSVDELRKIRDDLLMFVSETDTMPISVYQLAYENLYNIAADLGDWINAIAYYRESIEYKDELPRIQENILDGVSKNQKQFEKLLTFIEKNQSGYKRKSLVKIVGQLISFFFSKKKYPEVSKLVEKFTFNEIMKTNSGFEAAYSYVEVGRQNLAKDYYRAYLEEKGNNSAAANNLALLEEQDGNLIEAERLFQSAIEWDPKDDIAKRNHKRVLERIQKENEQKRAYQRAVDLYQQEQESIRFFLAKLHSTKTDDDLIFLSEEKLAEIKESASIDGEIDIGYFVNKKYVEEISDNAIQFDGRLFRFNTVLVPFLTSDLEIAKEREIISELTEELLSKNLDKRYGYNSRLQDSLSSVVSNELSKMLKRDLYETVIALVTKSYKSALILCGSIAEAILLDKLLAREESAIHALERILKRNGKAMSPSDKEILRWGLDRLLDVAFEEKIISDNLNHWGHGIRGFRNLVHPGLEQRRTIEISRENVEMAWNVVKRLLSEMKALNE